MDSLVNKDALSSGKDANSWATCQFSCGGTKTIRSGTVLILLKIKIVVTITKMQDPPIIILPIELEKYRLFIYKYYPNYF